MDKLEKALKKLAAGEKGIVKLLLTLIKNRRLTGLDVKKLKGQTDIFRVRKGKLRIIYQLKENEVKILAIERRTETTYKNF